jgi:glutaredoxin
MKNSAQTLETVKKQECTVQSLYLSGGMFVISYPLGLVYFAYEANWTVFTAWLIFLPLLKWAYLRFFPRISRWRGYGSIDDELPANVNKVRAEVTYYSLLGCPFCPIVKQRLEALQKGMDFTLATIDLTLKPQMAASKGIRSVPVVEVGKERLIGNATTEQLARLIAGAQDRGHLVQVSMP